VTGANLPNPSRLATEVLAILWEHFLLQRHAIDADGTLENLKNITIIQLLGNDIVVRLCKFRDTDTRSLSFDQVAKELRKRPATLDRALAVEKRLGGYRQLTLNLERHRDTYIAHLSKRPASELKPPLDMRDAIQMAVEIVDQLVGQRCHYEVERHDLQSESFGEGAA
jgi:hypothetical protein